MDYLEQFKKLPKELQEAVSSEEKIRILEEIEKKYNLKLAKLVVRVMIKDITWQDLEKFCQENFKLSSGKASELKKDLEEKIFNEVMEYLGVEKPSYEIRKDYPPQLAVFGEAGETTKVEKKPAITEAQKKIPSLSTSEASSEIQSLQGKQLEIEEIIKEVKERTGLSFADEILEKRFENIVSNFLKEVRKNFETEEILTRSEKIGGLGLEREKTNQVMKMLKEIQLKYGRDILRPVVGAKLVETKPELAEGILTPEEIIKPPVVEEMPIETVETEKLVETLPPAAAKLVETEEPEIKVDTDLKKRFNGGTITPIFRELEKPIKPSYELQKIYESTKIKEEEKKEEDLSAEARRAKAEEIPIQIRRPISEERLVEDVSGRLKVMGPIEELKEITLSDLKRWGGKQTCQIILNKINLLAEESLIKKAEGIRAWQKSSLYNLYLEIGEESLESKKSVAEVILERNTSAQPTISLEDFEEIAELNRRLRF